MTRSLRTIFALSAIIALPGCPDETDLPFGTSDVSIDTTTDTGGTDVGTDATDDADTTVDLCEGLELCDAAGLACDGDSLVDCAENADGCLVATETDCTEDGQICDADAGACVDDGGCEDACDAEGTLCDGGDIADCTMGADGCLVLEVTECGEGEICVDGDAGPVCEAGVDPCEGIEVCDDEGTFCDGGDIVTCTANDDACIVREVTTCDGGTECVADGETLACEPLCEDDAACAEEGQTCGGTVLSSCFVGDLGCLELATDDCAVLAEGGTCNPDTSLCEATGDPCADIESRCSPVDVGVSGCEGTSYAQCTLDAFGCGVVEQTECADVDGGFCGADGCEIVEAGTCDDLDPEIVCDEQGALTCGDLGPIECVRDTDGCLTLVELDACGDELACVEGRCAGACDDVVECETASFCDGDDVVECGDVDGCFVEVERTACDSSCEIEEGAFCVEVDLCLDFGCDAEFDFPFCDGALIFNCITSEDLGCDFYEPTDCSEVDGASCVDDGFIVECQAEPCGDGLFDGFVGEECDDGNNDNDDGCTSECGLEEGFDCETVDGTSVCAEIVCGDGIINGEETCDDEGTASLDGCDDLCAVEGGYECTGEPSLCLIPACGDGVRNADESCDDGNLDDGDGCTSECFIELSDVVLDTVTIEASLNATDAQYDRIGSGCTGSGDPDHFYDVYTIVNVLEAPIEILIDAAWSDDGFLHIFSSDFDPADPITSCLDGSDDFGGTAGSRIDNFIAEADTSYFVVASTYGAEATIDAYTLTLTTIGCGDGAISELEECDDGNTLPADGCDFSCAVEPDYDCDGEPSFCWIPDLCGGGLVDGEEECDDYNLDNGDGCSEFCTVEDGFICTGDLSFCEAAVCGDGVLGSTETCDDGNLVAGDGCSAACAIELLDGVNAEIDGSIDDTDSLFDRPSAVCSGGGAADHFYDSYGFENADAAPLSVVVTAAWDGDGYLHGYSSFDPADSEAGCIGGGDDFEGVLGSQITLEIAPASSFEVVASTYFGSTATGDYTLTLVPTALVPAP
ncbi:MAG: cysteine-rich repeat protein [Bradymonadia bacterium]|jgi:cysteine-rich repeat protein